MMADAQDQAPRAEKPRPPTPNEDAIKLWLIDSALMHLMRVQSIVGIGANVVRASLNEERDEIVKRLTRLGERFAAAEEDRRAG